MSSITTLSHNGKNIMYVDYQGLSKIQIIETIHRSNKLLQDESNDILFIANFTGIHADNDIFAVLKSETTKEVMKKVKRTGVIGITGLKKIFLNAFNQLTKSNARAFTSLEEAKDYVTKE